MTCPDCGYWKSICKCDDRIFNTPKDKLYKFKTFHLGKEYEFDSKRQWESHMKKHGLVQLMDSDLKKMEQPAKPEFKPDAGHRRELAKIMLNNIDERRRVRLR